MKHFFLFTFFVLLFSCDKDDVGVLIKNDYTFDVNSEKNELFVNDCFPIEFTVTGGDDHDYFFSWSTDKPGSLEVNSSSVEINKGFSVSPGTYSVCFFPDVADSYDLNLKLSSSGSSISKNLSFDVKDFDLDLSISKNVDVLASDQALIELDYSLTSNKYNSKLSYTLASDDGALFDTFKQTELPVEFALDGTKKLVLEYKYPKRIGDFDIFWTYSDDRGISREFKTTVTVKPVPFEIDISGESSVLTGMVAVFDLKINTSKSNLTYTIKDFDWIDCGAFLYKDKELDENIGYGQVVRNNNLTLYFDPSGFGDIGFNMTIVDDYGQEKTIKKLFDYYLDTNFSSRLNFESGVIPEVSRRIIIENNNNAMITGINIDGQHIDYDFECLSGSSKEIEVDFDKMFVGGDKLPKTVFDIGYEIEGKWKYLDNVSVE